MTPPTDAIEQCIRLTDAYHAAFRDVYEFIPSPVPEAREQLKALLDYITKPEADSMESSRKWRDVPASI